MFFEKQCCGSASPLMRIRIRLVPLMRIRFLIFFCANPDSTCPFDADPVTVLFLCESGFDLSLWCGSGYWSFIVRIRIRLVPLMRIRLLIFFCANPDSTCPFGADPVTDLFWRESGFDLSLWCGSGYWSFFVRIRIRLVLKILLKCFRNGWWGVDLIFRKDWSKMWRQWYLLESFTASGGRGWRGGAHGDLAYHTVSRQFCCPHLTLYVPVRLGGQMLLFLLSFFYFIIGCGNRKLVKFLSIPSGALMNTKQAKIFFYFWTKSWNIFVYMTQYSTPI